MPRKYGALSSSVDPSQLSLTVESFGKVLIGVIVWFAASKSLDVTAAQTQLQAILDLVIQGIPLVFTLWNVCMGVWGAIRKVLVAFTAQQ